MANLSFRTFVWTQNPHTYQESTKREPKYRTQSGVTSFVGMGDMQRIITGSGVFHGEDAYTRFKELQKLMEEGTAGNLEHPVWGIRYCYMTGLNLVQEPRENQVSYSFEFTQASTNGEVPE